MGRDGSLNSKREPLRRLHSWHPGVSWAVFIWLLWEREWIWRGLPRHWIPKVGKTCAYLGPWFWKDDINKGGKWGGEGVNNWYVSQSELPRPTKPRDGGAGNSRCVQAVVGRITLWQHCRCSVTRGMAKIAYEEDKRELLGWIAAATQLCHDYSTKNDARSRRSDRKVASCHIAATQM